MLLLRTAESRMSDDIQSSAAGEDSPAAYVKQPINRRSFVVAAVCAFFALLGLSAPIVMIVDPNFIAHVTASPTLLIGVAGIVAVAAALAACVSSELCMPRSWTERVINVAALVPFWAFAVIVVMGATDYRLPNLYIGGLAGIATCFSTLCILIYVWSLELAPGKIKLLKARLRYAMPRSTPFPLGACATCWAMVSLWRS